MKSSFANWKIKKCLPAARTNWRLAQSTIVLLFAEERLPAIPSGDHEDEDDDGVDDDKYGDDDLHQWSQDL